MLCYSFLGFTEFSKDIFHSVVAHSLRRRTLFSEIPDAYLKEEKEYVLKVCQMLHLPLFAPQRVKPNSKVVNAVNLSINSVRTTRSLCVKQL